MDSELSEEFEVNVGMHKELIPAHFLFAIVVNVVAELASESVLSELLYADGLILMTDIIK